MTFFMKIRTFLYRLTLPLRRSKIYRVYVADTLTEVYEDPKCPSRWRGSGCYDITCYGLQYHLFRVTARDGDEAEDLVMSHICSHPDRYGDTDILGTVLEGPDPDRQSGDVFEEECGRDYPSWSEKWPDHSFEEALCLLR